MDLLDSLFRMVDIMRTLVTKDAIRRLNKLDWDKKLYANFQFADGTWGLEINYTIRGKEWKYKVECDDREDMHQLRRELDGNVV